MTIYVCVCVCHTLTWEYKDHGSIRCSRNGRIAEVGGWSRSTHFFDTFVINKSPEAAEVWVLADFMLLTFPSTVVSIQVLHILYSRRADIFYISKYRVLDKMVLGDGVMEVDGTAGRLWCVNVMKKAQVSVDPTADAMY